MRIGTSTGHTRATDRSLYISIANSVRIYTNTQTHTTSLPAVLPSWLRTGFLIRANRACPLSDVSAHPSLEPLTLVPLLVSPWHCLDLLLFFDVLSSPSRSSLGGISGRARAVERRFALGVISTSARSSLWNKWLLWRTLLTSTNINENEMLPMITVARYMTASLNHCLPSRVSHVFPLCASATIRGGRRPTSQCRASAIL